MARLKEMLRGFGLQRTVAIQDRLDGTSSSDEAEKESPPDTPRTLTSRDELAWRRAYSRIS